MNSPVLVLGGDSNGLTAACYLAKAGRSVTLLTHGPLGGLASRHEFHPGYQSPGVLGETSGLRRSVVSDLQLEQHGLRFADNAGVLAIGPDSTIAITNSRDATTESIRGVSARDADRYREYFQFLDSVRAPLTQFLNSPPPDLVDPSFTDIRGLLMRGFQLRRLGKALMLEVLRLAPMAVYDWMDEWFENDLLKAALALPAVTESYTAPWSAGTNANLLAQQVTGGNDVVGDGLALTDALVQAARSLGVDIREQTVASIDPGRGVETTDGESISATTIVTSLDPKTVFLRLLRPELLDHGFEQRITNYRARGLRSQLLLAIDRPLKLRDETPANRLRLVSSLASVERSFDPIKYGRFSDEPSLEVYLPSADHPELAPDGHAVAAVTIHYTPYDLAGGWTERSREELTRLVIQQLGERLPDLADTIVGHELLAPPDIETRYGVTGGHVFHGEHSLDQLLVRPTPECCQYTTPFPGLVLCGGGTFPGGGLTCAPGALASRVVAK